MTYPRYALMGESARNSRRNGGVAAAARQARVVDGRLYSTAQLGSMLGVTANTVCERLRKLAARGIGQPTMAQLRGEA